MRRIYTPAEAAAELLHRKRARTSLLHFTTYTRENYLVGRHSELICNALDMVLEGHIRNLMIEAPPRHGKSEIVSRRFPAYAIGRRPDLELIATPYNTRLAAVFGRHNRNLIDSQRYRNVFPDVSIASDSRANDLWHTTAGGVYLATGVDAGQTGWGANIYLFDDILKGISEADSENIKNTKWNWYLAEAYTRQMPDFAQIMVQTRWALDDICGRALEVEDPDHPWVRLKFPAIINEGEPNEEALHEERYSLEKLHGIKHTFMSSGRVRMWKSLYQQEPTVESGNYIQRDWFTTRYSTFPAKVPMNIYIASDYAVTEPKEGEKPDWTEHGVFGLDPTGQLYVLDWWSGQTRSDVWVDELIRLIKKWKPICVFGEKGQIRRSVEPWLEKRLEEEKVHAWFEWLSVARDKAARGRAFQGMAAQKRIIFGKQVWAQEVVEQCVLFPGAGDDKFDVMTHMCNAIHTAHEAIQQAHTSGRKPVYGYEEDLYDPYQEYEVDYRTV